MNTLESGRGGDRKSSVGSTKSNQAAIELYKNSARNANCSQKSEIQSLAEDPGNQMMFTMKQVEFLMRFGQLISSERADIEHKRRTNAMLKQFMAKDDMYDDLEEEDIIMRFDENDSFVQHNSSMENSLIDRDEVDVGVNGGSRPV